MPDHKSNVTPIQQFHPGNWEYILTKVAEKVRETEPPTEKLFQEAFNKLIEERYNAIATVHQPLALKIARKFDFKTAEEIKNQYFDVPTWRYSSK